MLYFSPVTLLTHVLGALSRDSCPKTGASVRGGANVLLSYTVGRRSVEKWSPRTCRVTNSASYPQRDEKCAPASAFWLGKYLAGHTKDLPRRRVADLNDEMRVVVVPVVVSWMWSATVSRHRSASWCRRSGEYTQSYATRMNHVRIFGNNVHTLVRRIVAGSRNKRASVETFTTFFFSCFVVVIELRFS